MPKTREALSRRWRPRIVEECLSGNLAFRPAPPGDARGSGLKLQKHRIRIDAKDDEFSALQHGLKNGIFSSADLAAALDGARLSEVLSRAISRLLKPASDTSGWDDIVGASCELDRMALLVVKVIQRSQESLLKAQPLTEISFDFSDRARAVIALGWEAMAKRGIFPLPPKGRSRISALQKKPVGAMHFVSASDVDCGYRYTMGIALSPEAQALGSMDLTFGLDGELIVPGQAVSPIPPSLAMATRLFAAGIPTSSNISEEEQSIPMRNYPHPTSYDDLQPMRGGLYRPPARFETVSALIDDVRQQLWRNQRPRAQSVSAGAEVLIDHVSGDSALPPIKAVIEVTELAPQTVQHLIKDVLADKFIAQHKDSLALYLNIESTCANRVAAINAIVDVAALSGIKYVAVADDDEDQWLPNLLEYLEPFELNAVADHSDGVGVIVVDGRPVDPIYTAATAAQRIQSVYCTLAVDILKMGMWLCLDALAARTVYRELLKNPHIPARMMLMPIGIIEPWDAFVDNRDSSKTPRAILDPFEKVKFMIEEARVLGAPSLLTDTRHKETWVLLGRKTDADEPHPREEFVRDPSNGDIISRTAKSAIPLLSFAEFMECERLAREAGVFLGQAGSVETPQLFRIISETTYDAAKEGRNPATAVWTAETERVLTTKAKSPRVDLQTERSAEVSPFLATVNRAYEAHAKLDGWLRYLEELKPARGTLRKDLTKRRQRVEDRLNVLLEAQGQRDESASRAFQQAYQRAWEAFSTEFRSYHELLKRRFVQIRDEVAATW